MVIKNVGQLGLKLNFHSTANHNYVSSSDKDIETFGTDSNLMQYVKELNSPEVLSEVNFSIDSGKFGCCNLNNMNPNERIQEQIELTDIVMNGEIEHHGKSPVQQMINRMKSNSDNKKFNHLSVN